MTVWSPRITSPTTGTVWAPGSSQKIEWDTSDAPESISNGPMVLLAKGGVQDTSHPLAKDFDLRAGCVTIIVPADASGFDYAIVLFGDSGNISAAFTIA